MKTKTLWMCSIVLFLMGLPIICFGKGEIEEAEAEKKPVPVTISALKGPTGIGMVKLFKDKPSYGENVEAEYKIVGSPDVMLARIISKETDIASLPTNVAIKIFNKGVMFKLGAITGFGMLYVITTNPNITSWKDLKGKHIYNIGKHATPDIVFRYLLKQNTIDPDNDLTIDFKYKHIELAQSLIAGRVDTGILPEPFITKVLRGNKDMRIALDFQKEWNKVQDTEKSYPMSCVVVSNKLIQEHPDIVKNYLSEYEKSIQWVNQNPAEAGKAVENIDFGMKADDAEKAIPRLNLEYISAQNSKQMVDRYFQVLYEFNPSSIGGAMPDENFFAPW